MSAASDRADDLFDVGFFTDVDELFRSFNVGGRRVPFVVAVQAKTFWLASVHDVFVGLAWDDAARIAAPAVLMAAGTTAFIEIDAIEGTRLEVWTDSADELVDARILTVEQAAAEQGLQRDSGKPPALPSSGGLIAGAVVLVIGVVALARR